VLVLQLRLADLLVQSHLLDLVVLMDQAHQLDQSLSYQVDLLDQVDLQGLRYLLVLLVQVHPVDQWDLVVQVQHVHRRSLVVQQDQAHPPVQVVRPAQLHLKTIPNPPQFVASHEDRSSYLQHLLTNPPKLAHPNSATPSQVCAPPEAIALPSIDCPLHPTMHRE